VRRSKALPFGGEWHKVNPAPVKYRKEKDRSSDTTPIVAEHLYEHHEALTPKAFDATESKQRDVERRCGVTLPRISN